MFFVETSYSENQLLPVAGTLTYLGDQILLLGHSM